jgi:hypothetical protein
MLGAAGRFWIARAGYAMALHFHGTAGLWRGKVRDNFEGAPGPCVPPETGARFAG